MTGHQPENSTASNFISNFLINTPVTALLVAVNVSMFTVLMLTGGSDDATNLYRWGAKFGPAIQDGDWHRLILPVILHAGILHLATNTFALIIFGPRLEEEFGRTAFLATYIVSGIGGVAASYLVSPTLSVGASGAIFGIVGAYGTYLVRNRKEFGNSVNPVIINLLIILGINIVFGLVWEGIDQGAHIGGLIAGAAMSMFVSPRRIIEIEDDFYIFGAPTVRVRIQRAPINRVLTAASIGVGIAFAIAWWVTSNAQYDSDTMQNYRLFELLAN